MVPNGPEICKKQLYNLVDKVERVEVHEEEIAPFIDEIYKKLSWMERDDLIKSFVSVEFNRFLAYYENAPDLNVHLPGNAWKEDRFDSRTRAEKRDRTQRKEREPREKRNNKVEFDKLFINLRSKNNLTPGKLIGLINERVTTRGIEIGQIEMMKSFAFFEADNKHTQEIILAMNGMQWGAVKVVLEVKTSEQRNRRPKHAPGYDRGTEDPRPKLDQRRKKKGKRSY